MALAAQDKTLFVSSLISDGERTPLFTDNAEYASIHENYGKTTGKITYVGEKNMYRLGEQSRDRFINSGFLPLSYDPTTIFVRWPSDNVSILSGYSYIMGIYPTTIEGVDLMRGFDELTTVPISESEINNVRQEIGVSRPECGDQRLDVYPGNSDREFLIKPMSLYPGQKDLIKRKINDAKDDFERMYGKRLYQALAEAKDKDPNDINSSNAIFYLDDYITAKANVQRIPYTLDPQTEDLINEYYTYYYERGIFGDHAVARLFTSSYFTNLGKELLSKHSALTEGQDNDKFIRNLKHSLYVGNDQTFVAIMHQLGERHKSRPSFSQQINWIFFDRRGEFYVKAESGGRPLRLEGNANEAGETELSIFIEYLWSKLYYGDIELAAKGVEDPHQFDNTRISWKDHLSAQNTAEAQIFYSKLSEFTDTPRPWYGAQIVQSPTNSNSISNTPQSSSNSWSSTPQSTSNSQQTPSTSSSTRPAPIYGQNQNRGTSNGNTLSPSNQISSNQSSNSQPSNNQPSNSQSSNSPSSNNPSSSSQSQRSQSYSQSAKLSGSSTPTTITEVRKSFLYNLKIDKTLI